MRRHAASGCRAPRSSTWAPRPRHWPPTWPPTQHARPEAAGCSWASAVTSRSPVHRPAADGASASPMIRLPGRLAVAMIIGDADDHRHGEAPGQTVAIEAGGLATSSVTVRRAGTGADSVSHLIDPGTGLPVDGPWRTVSVTAATCVDANIASTAAMVLGADAVGWLEANQLPARLVAHDGSVRYVAGWPQEGDDL